MMPSLDQTEKVPQSQDQREKQLENDRMLAQALTNLTFEERQKHQDSVHGVIENVQEEEIFIENCLVELDQHLLAIKKGSVYELAESMDSNYVRNRNFRVMFLRGNRYNAQASAEQMLRFFQEKQSLFGFNKLTKDITIDDLNEDDLESLNCGSIQMLGRDRSNRQICINVPGLRSFKKTENELRAAFYIFMAALQSEETQLFGFVVIGNHIGDCKDKKGGEGWYELTKVCTALPIYAASMHLLCSDIAVYAMTNVVLKLINPDLRARFQMHLGSQLECQYKLSSYGIGLEELGSGPGNLQRHWRWVQNRQELEGGRMGRLKPKAMDAADGHLIAGEPLPDDVVFGGRGPRSRGSELLKVLIRERSEEYESRDRGMKLPVVDGVIETIRENGGRFLQPLPQSGTWIEVSQEEARARISKSFRNFRRTLKRHGRSNGL